MAASLNVAADWLVEFCLEKHVLRCTAPSFTFNGFILMTTLLEEQEEEDDNDDV